MSVNVAVAHAATSFRLQSSDRRQHFSRPPRRRLPDRPRRAAAAVASVSGSDAVTFVIEPMPKEREPRLDASFLDTLIIFK